MPWPDCAPCHSLPDGGGGNRPPSGQPNVPANSRQSGLRVPLAVSSPRYLALTNIRRRSQSLPAATEDKHRPPSTPNRARTIALPCPYRPFRCCIVIPSVDLGLEVACRHLPLNLAIGRPFLSSLRYDNLPQRETISTMSIPYTLTRYRFRVTLLRDASRFWSFSRGHHPRAGWVSSSARPVP